MLNVNVSKSGPEGIDLNFMYLLTSISYTGMHPYLIRFKIKKMLQESENRFIVQSFYLLRRRFLLKVDQ